MASEFCRISSRNWRGWRARMALKRRKTARNRALKLWFKSRTMTGNPRLGVFILFVFAAGNASAQQSSGANVDSQQRISQPNRSVNAVDLDPEKSKDDAGARGMAPQSSSSWGIKRTEAQKTSLDGAKVPDKLSSWTLES